MNTDNYEGDVYVMPKARMRIIVENAHRLLGKRYKSSPLWSLVSDLTGHGSSMSCNLLKGCGVAPCQPCGNKVLEKLTPT